MEGPAIFIAWSMGGGMGQRLVLRRPDLFRALILLDGYCGEKRFPQAGNWFDNGPISAANEVAKRLVDGGIPLLNINSAAGHFSNTGHAKKLGTTLTDKVASQGGVARTIYLPDIGIQGNGHMMFFEKNSDAIAEVLTGWIDDTIPGHR
jgi:pimeloyl-ACP methyl ester carboxylesterase